MSRAGVAALSEPRRVSEPQYLYAIVVADPGLELGGAGVAEAPVYALGRGEVAAVLSALPDGRIRPERRNLAAHQQVMLRLMQQGAVLPVAFGTIAASPASVRRFLAANRKALAAQLGRVRGKVEMGVRVTWEVPNIFEYFVERQPELRQARDRLFGAQHEPTHEEKLGIGRLFERLLEEQRELHTGRVEEALAGCAEVRRARCRSENEVMNVACLVARGDLTAFEEAVFAAARHFDNSFAFDYNGPWPPYHFVDLDLRV